MAATQIESFCERCGTKYTFDQRPERGRLLKDLGRTLGFLAEEGAPDDGPLTSRDPFHGTFRFCLECRQYTCPSCWNDAAGFCQGCAPLAQGQDMTDAEAFAAVEAASHLRHAMTEVNLLRSPEAWPDVDLSKPGADQVADVGLAKTGLAGSAFVASESSQSELPVEVQATPREGALAPVIVDADELFAGPWDAIAPADEQLEPDAGIDWSALPHPDLSVEPVADAPVAMTADPEPEASVAQLAAAPEPERESETATSVLEGELVGEPEAEPLPLAAATSLETDAPATTEAQLPATAAREMPSLMTPVTELSIPQVPAPSPAELPRPVVPAPRPAAPIVPQPLPSLMRPPEAPPQPVATRPAAPGVVEPSATQPVPPPPPSPFAPAQPPTMTPAAVPASRLAALFGRGRKQTEPETMPPAVPSVLPSGWRITAEDAAPSVPSAAFLPRPEATPQVVAQARPSLIAGPSQAHSTPGIRPCYQCALPLSATARFCRRCGTPQQPNA